MEILNAIAILCALSKATAASTTSCGAILQLQHHPLLLLLLPLVLENVGSLHQLLVVAIVILGATRMATAVQTGPRRVCLSCSVFKYASLEGRLVEVQVLFLSSINWFDNCKRFGSSKVCRTQKITRVFIGKYVDYLWYCIGALVSSYQVEKCII